MTQRFLRLFYTFRHLIRDELGHKDIGTTQRNTEIPLKRLEDDFPTYAKSAKNDDVLTQNVLIEPFELESLVGK